LHFALNKRMPFTFLILSAFTLISLAFAGAIAVESRRAERARHTFLRSIGAPVTILLHGGMLRIVYLIGSLALALLCVLLPSVLGLPLSNALS
jgi:hypothetical protein